MKEDRKQHDQLFTLFTEKYGKIRVLGKSIRKITSKLRSGAELFYLSEIEFIEGKTNKILTDTVLIDNFKSLRENYENLLIAYKIAEKFVLAEEVKDEQIWFLLLQTLERLNEGKTDFLYLHFLWNFFAFIGYTPELYNCSLCDKKLLPETLFFVPKEGGVCCWRCKTEDKKEITVGAIQILRILLKKDYEINNRIRATQLDVKNLEEISSFYFSFLKNIVNPHSLS